MLSKIQSPTNVLNQKIVEANKNECGEKQPEIKDGKKKLALALGALGIAGAVGLGIAFKRKGLCATTLKDIKFSNGIAKKNGGNFSGKIKDTLKNGDKIILEYKDGILQSSRRNGKQTFQKTYGYINGEKFVHKNIGTETTSVNITQKIQKVKNEIIEKEIKKRQSNIQKAEEYAMQAQKRYNAPFENALSNKSAKKSAEIFNESFKDEIIKKQKTEHLAKKQAENAQKKFNQPFEDALSKKSARESAIDIVSTEEKRKRTCVKNTIDEKGNKLKITTSKNGFRVLMEEKYDETGKIISRIAEHKDYETLPRRVETTYVGKKKTTVNSDNYGCTIHKQYLKDSKGKYKLKTRDRIVTSSYGSDMERKLVEHLDNGTSRTTLESNILNTQRIIIRDKKGNVLSDITKPLKDNGLGPQSPPEQPVYLYLFENLNDNEKLDRLRVMLKSNIHTPEEISTFAKNDSFISHILEQLKAKTKSVTRFIDLVKLYLQGIIDSNIVKAKTNIDIHRPIEKSLYQFSFDTNPQEFIQEVQEAFVHV